MLRLVINLVPRSHSVLHWKVRSPFPLAEGDLGTRLIGYLKVEQGSSYDSWNTIKDPYKQTSVILWQRPPKPYKLLIFFHDFCDIPENGQT